MCHARDLSIKKAQEHVDWSRIYVTTGVAAKM